jgi:hypothetical protein
VFVRKRQSKGETYYAVVESYREAGNVKHRQVVALGTNPDLERAIEATRRAIRQTRGRLTKLVAVYPQGAAVSPRAAREREKITKALALQEERLKLLTDARQRMAPAA